MEVVAIPDLGVDNKSFADALADHLNRRGTLTLHQAIPFTDDPIWDIRQRLIFAEEMGAEVVLLYGVYGHMHADLKLAAPYYRTLAVRSTEFTVDILGGDGIWRGAGMDEVVRRVN